MMKVDVFDASFVDPQVPEDLTETRMEPRPQTSVAVVGILVTILIFLLVQTAGIAYWAGQQSSRQDSTATQILDLKNKFEIIQAQYQVMSNDLATIKAGQTKGR